MREIISIIIPSIFLYFYMLLSSIEFGSSFFRLFPNLLKKGDTIKNYTNPVWETTNVFLVYFIVSMFSFFPGANFQLGTNLLLVIFVALIFMGLRVVGMLAIFYGDGHSKAIDFLFFIGSFGAPIILSLVFIYMLTGEWWSLIFTPLYLGLAGIIVSNILLISALFFNYFEARTDNFPLRKMIKTSFYLLFIFIMIFLYSISIYAPYIFSNLSKVIIFVALTLATIIVFMLAFRLRKNLVSFLAAAALMAVLFFSFLSFHLPYIIYPNITIYNSFTDPASYNLMMISFVVGAIFILPSLFLLYYLFVFGEQTEN